MIEKLEDTLKNVEAVLAYERPRLVRLCTRITGSPGTAEDLAQETLLEAWCHLNSLHDPEKLPQWLSGIARNICLRWGRKQSRDNAHLLELRSNPGSDERLDELDEMLVDDFDLEIELERKELAALLDQAMKQGEDFIQTHGSAQIEKNSLPIWALFIANAVSYVGDILMLLGIPWLVLQTTGSPSKAGITAFFSMLAIVISSFFGSLIIDRLGYKRTSVLGDIASGIAVALIPLLYHTLGLAFWQLQILVFLAGLLQTPGSEARYSLLPDLIKLSQMPSERANSLYDGVRRISGFIGAPIAGALIIIIGTSNLLWIDSATFFFSALLLAWAVPHTPPIKKEKKQGNYIHELQEGLSFIWNTPMLMATVITIMITNALDQGMIGVIQPTYAREIFRSPIALGSLVAAFGGAAFIGTLIFALIGHRLPRRRTLGIGFTLSTILRFLPLILVLPLPAIIGAYILAGLMIGPINPIFSTVSQEIVPVEMRARIFGALSAGVFLGMPLGGLIAGFLIDGYGLIPTLLIFGSIYLLSASSLLLNPALKGMDELGKKPVPEVSK